MQHALSSYYLKIFSSNDYNSLLPCNGSKVPIKIDIDTIKTSSNRKALMDHCKNVMEEELFYWSDDLSCILPETKFSLDNNKSVPLFKNPPNLDELQSVAIDNNGKRKKLTKTQLNDIRQTGCFSVPSTIFNNKEHKWQLTRLLQTGNNTHKYVFYYGLSSALYNLSIKKDLIVSKEPLSLRNALSQIPKTCRDLLALFVGIPEMKLWDSMQNLLENRRCEYLLREFYEPILNWLDDMEEIRKNKGNLLCYDKGKLTTIIEGNQEIHLDLRLWDPNIMIDLDDIICNINNKVFSDWNAIKKNFISECIEKEFNNIDDNTNIKDIEYKIQEICREKYNNDFLNLLRKNKKLKHIGQDIIALIEASFHVDGIINNTQIKLNSEIEDLVSKTKNQVKIDHSIRSLINSWLENETEYRVKQHLNIPITQSITEYKRIELLKRVIHNIENFICQLQESSDSLLIQKLDEKLYLLKRDLEWYSKEIENARIWIDNNMKIPSKHFSFSASIILMKNYIVSQNSDNTYSYKSSTTHSVSSNVWFWRWKVFYMRCFSYFKNVSAACKYSICNGRYSYKALFYKNEFPIGISFNNKTGQFKPSSIRAPTLLSKLNNIWNSVITSRRIFEAHPDNGFIGKGVTRIYNIFWNYGIKLGLGFPLSIFFSLISVTLNILISLIISILNIIGSPLATLLKYLVHILIFDFDYSKVYGYKYFPLFYIIIGRLGFGCILQIVLVLLTLIIKPILALLSVICGTTISSFGYIYDLFMYYLVIKFRGRIPVSDSFAARRISGPGLGSTYYYQISEDNALTLIQLYLEKEELSLFKQAVNAQLSMPKELYSNFIENVFSVFGLISNNTNKKTFDNSKFQKRFSSMLSNRYKSLPNINNIQYLLYCVRLSPEDLTSVFSKSKELIQTFTEKNIHETLFHNNEELIKLYWQNMGIDVGDYDELVNYILTNVFSREFLFPLEDSDCSVRLSVENTLSVKKFISMVKNNEMRDDLVKVDVLKSKMAPTVKDNVLLNTNFSYTIDTFTYHTFSPISQPKYIPLINYGKSTNLYQSKFY